MAGLLVRSGFRSHDAILAALLAENISRCKPPLPRDEVERIANSATRWKPQPWISDPNGFVTDDRLSHRARHLLMVLAEHADDEGSCFPGYRRLSNITGIGKNYIGRYIDELAENDRIRIRKGPNGKRSYQLLAVPTGGTEVPQ